MIFPKSHVVTCQSSAVRQTASQAPFLKLPYHDVLLAPAPGPVLALALSPRLCGDARNGKAKLARAAAAFFCRKFPYFGDKEQLSSRP